MTLGVLAAAAASSSAASSSASDDVGAGVIAFLVIAAMGVALVFLLRSMNKQFRKITPAPGPAGSEGADSEGADGEAEVPAQTPE